MGAGKMKKYCLITVLLVTVSMPAVAVAQDVGSENAEHASADTIVVTGSRQVRTATKTDTPLLEVPQSVSVISEEMIELRNYQRLTDALRFTAGVQTGKFGNDVRYEQIEIRGFSASVFGDYRDGLRQSSPSSSLFVNEPYGLEAIEIFKGPSSVLYGENAPGGLVNVVSKRPRFTDTFGEFQVDIGNWDRRQLKFDVGGGATQKGDVRYRVTGLVRDGEADLEETSRDDRVFIAPSIEWDIGQHTQLWLYAQYVDAKGTGSPFGLTNSDGTFIDTRTYDPNFDASNRVQYLLGYELAHAFSDRVEFRQKARYANIDFLLQTVYSLGGTPGQTVFERYAFEVATGLENIALDNQLIGNLKLGSLSVMLLGGFDYSRMRANDTAAFGVGPSQGISDLDINNPVFSGPERPRPAVYSRTRQINKQLGFYGQAQLKLDGFIATLGGRFDDTSSSTDDLINSGLVRQSSSEFTWRAGFAKEFEFGFVPYISYATSFQLTPGFDIGGNPFVPSLGKQFEAGVKYEPEAFPGLVTLSYFNLTQNNVPTTDPDNLGSGFQIQTGEIRSRGVELEASLSPTKGFALGSTYSYIDLEVTKSENGDQGFAPPASPKHFASIWAKYEFEDGPLQGLGFGGAFRYIGKSYSDQRETLVNRKSSFGDLFAFYETGPWRLALNIDNITNKQNSMCSFGFCYQVVGRSVLGSLRYRFGN